MYVAWLYLEEDDAAGHVHPRAACQDRVQLLGRGIRAGPAFTRDLIKGTDSQGLLLLGFSIKKCIFHTVYGELIEST